MIMDPRVEGIRTMLCNVRTIIPVVSGKGGVGKSLISTTMALLFSKRGVKVGLLDLDFHGACDHIILGANIEKFPEEDKGVIPPEVHGIKFMTIVYYSKEMPVPLRGEEITDAIVELLAITRWGDLDVLVIDMPPGLGDTFLDTIKLFERGKYVIVTTTSPLSVSVVKRLVTVLKEQNLEILGLVENMREESANKIAKLLAEDLGINYLGSIGYYPEVDSLLGYPDKILSSRFANDLSKIIEKIRV